MKTEQQIIDYLHQTGHLRFPFGKAVVGPWPTAAMTVDSPQVREAIASIQALWTPQLESIQIRQNPLRVPYVSITGEIDQATEELLNTARCACPDYYPGASMAIGKGNWPNCWGADGFHRVIVSVQTAGIPSFLKPVWENVKAKVKAAYAAIGLDIIFKDNITSGYNLKMSFVEPDGGWIGLALVLNGQKCSDIGWCRFAYGYKPENVEREWITLIMHELGHNVGMSHSQGGVMNPFIIKGLSGSWIGDPSQPLLEARFGGKPVPGGPIGPNKRELVTAWRYIETGAYEVINVIGADTGSPIPGPFPTDI